MGLLEWAIGSLIVSMLAGAFAFGGATNNAATTAKIIFGLVMGIALILSVLQVLGVGAVAQNIT